MTDIFIESEDLKSIRNFVIELRASYEQFLKTAETLEPGTYLDIDQTMLKQRLGVNWPGDDIVGQLVKDACKLMRFHNILPEDLG